MIKRSSLPVIFIATSAVLFLVYYFVIVINIQAVTDDFYPLSKLQNGFLYTWKFHFDHWNGRVSGATFINGFFKLSGGLNYFRVASLAHFICILGLLIYSFFKLLGVALKMIGSAMFPAAVRLLFAIIAVALLFWSMVNITETWLWTNASFVYITSIALALLGLVSIFNKRNNVIHFLISLLCFGYVGGANEMTAVFFGIALTYILFLSIRNNNFNIIFSFKNDAIIQKALLALTGLGLLLAVNFFSASTKHRMEKTSLEAASNKHLGIGHFYENDSVIAELTNKRIAISLVLCTAFFYFGSKLKEENEKTSKDILKNLEAGITLTAAATLLSILIPVLLLGHQSHWTDVGPKRAWATFSLPFTLLIISVSIYLGYSVSKKIAFPILLFSQFIFSAVTVYLIHDYSSRLPVFSTAYTQRLEDLQKLKQNNYSGTFTLKPLPPSLVLADGRLSSNPDAPINAAFTEALGLAFKVKEQE